MVRLVEKNKEDKEEVLEFGEEVCNSIRMLGSYMGWKEDVSQRSRRACMVLSKVKRKLKGTKMFKTMQAKILSLVLRELCSLTVKPGLI
jgi:hypothetical protein